jgi:hypothetical protein
MESQKPLAQGGKKMRRPLWKVLLVIICLNLVAASSTIAGVVTFDTFSFSQPAIPFPYDSVYTENGMMVISRSHYAGLGDNFHSPFVVSVTSNTVYFHGVDEYIEFRLVNGSRFNLLSLDLFTNGYSGRTLETSAAANLALPNDSGHVSFSGPEYSNLEWFRARTSWFATELDNITFSSAIPIPSSLLLFGSGLVGLIGIRRRFTR